jgi:hypothetical protein
VAVEASLDVGVSKSGPLRTAESRRRSRGRKLATHALALDDAPPGEVTSRGGGDERQRHADKEKQGDETKSSQGFGGSACSFGLPLGGALGVVVTASNSVTRLSIRSGPPRCKW